MGSYAIHSEAEFRLDLQKLKDSLQLWQLVQEPAAQTLLQLLDSFAVRGMFEEDSFLAQAEKLWHGSAHLTPSDRAALLLLLTRFHGLVREFPIANELYPFLYAEALRDPSGFNPCNQVFWGDLIFNGLVYQIDKVRAGKAGSEANTAVFRYLVDAQRLLQSTDSHPLAYAVEWYLQQREPLNASEADAYQQAFAGNLAVINALAKRPH